MDHWVKKVIPHTHLRGFRIEQQVYEDISKGDAGLVLNTLNKKTQEWNMTDIPLLQKKAYDHRDLWIQQKKIVPVIDDVLERRLKSQSLISNTLVATLAESL